MNWQPIKRSVAILLLPMMASGQELPSPTVTLTSSSATLQLPGSLTLNTRVDPGAGSLAMPSGSVFFVSDGTTIGNSALVPIPSTESFPATATPIALNVYPYGGVSFPSSSVGYSGVALTDSYYDATRGTYDPEFTTYTGPGISAPVAYQLYSGTCTCPNGASPDGTAVGDFNHDGVQDIVIHGSNQATNSGEYFVVPGKPDGTFDVTNTIASTDNSGFKPSDATLNFTVDDFNGDGYADVAYQTSDAIVGVSLNQGSGAPGSFNTFSPLPAPTPAAAGGTFLPNTITSGHLTSSGNADLIVGGLDTSTNGESVAVYLGNGDGTFASPNLIPVEILSASYSGLATFLAVGDLRKSGNKDLVVARQTFDGGLEQYVGDVTVLSNKGNGTFSVSTPIALSEAPSNVAVADFNGDGYPDIFVTGVQGDLFLYFNDGTGNFGTPTELAAPVETYSPLTLVNDLNGDGLPDVVEFGDNGDTSTAYEFLNSASSQAKFVTPAKSLPAGNHTLTSAFAANTNFAAATSADVPISVTQSPTTISWPMPAPLTYGTPLGSGQLDASGSVPGSFSFSSPAGTVLPAGQNRVTATFAPTDSFDYAPSTATQTIVVLPAATTISWPAPASLVYGTPLGSGQLDAVGSVPGSFSYSPPAGTVLPAGQTVVTATFTPTDSVDYTPSTATQTITVTRANPKITWPSPASVVYGTPLGSGQLDATGSVPGNFSYSPPAGTVLPAGQNIVTASFTPTDIVDYAPSTATQTITVTRAGTTISWATLASIPYGTPLGSSQLNAVGSVPGSFSYTPPAGTVLPAGQNVITATFTPTDSVDYSPSTATQTITVTRGNTTISWAAPAALEYGTPLGSAQLDAVGSVKGSFSYSPAAGTVLPPGQSAVTATFTPTDSVDYTTATATQTITVNSPSFSSIAPAGGNLGDPATTITISGQGLVNGAVVSFNGSPLPTTWVSLNELTAVIPASDLLTSGPATIKVSDPGSISVSGSATFTVAPAQAVATVSVPATTEAGQNSQINLTFSPYPVAVTPVLTLSFTPDPPNTVGDPTIGFSNNSTTLTLPTIPANSSAPIDPIPFSVGTTAGTITLTVQFTTLQDGVIVTIPSNLQPTVITVPATPPSINSVTLSRSGKALTVTVIGISSTREMTQATFHFTASPGNTLKTTDLTVQLSSPFSSYYQSAASDQGGTGYLYTQPFTLNTDSDTVGSVTVTLSNSQGESQPITAQ